MEKSEIWVAFTTPASEASDQLWALGNIWRITAKKTDFYIDPLGENSAFHLSIHGPNEQHSGGHRFHVKADRKAVNEARARGDLSFTACRGRGIRSTARSLHPECSVSPGSVGAGIYNGPATGKPRSHLGPGRRS